MINKLIQIFNKHHILRYLVIGGFNTCACLLVYYILLQLNVHYLVASSITNVFGVLEGYILNSILVFKNKVKFTGLLRYSTVYTIGFINNLILMYIFVDIANLGKFIAQVLTIAIATILNYWMVKRFVFSKAN